MPDRAKGSSRIVAAHQRAVKAEARPGQTAASGRSNEDLIVRRTEKARKHYDFNQAHDPNRPVEFWFQESEEGRILFVVFYSQACRWSRCLGCNLPSQSSKSHIDFKALMAQVDYVLGHSSVRHRQDRLRKIIVSNNGSVLDENTFSSTALMYLIAKLNLDFPSIRVVSLETRVEHVDPPELEFLSRALREGGKPTALELAVGFEAFDDRIRNRLFLKGLRRSAFEKLCRSVAKYGFHLKCYFMQKPVNGMTDEEAIHDIQAAIDYLSRQARENAIRINLHLNPTYVARGTILEDQFHQGAYRPPFLRDVLRAVLHGEGKAITQFVGLSDEGLACEGGSFIRRGDRKLVSALQTFNRTQDYARLGRTLLAR